MGLACSECLEHTYSLTLNPVLETASDIDVHILDARQRLTRLLVYAQCSVEIGI